VPRGRCEREATEMAAEELELRDILKEVQAIRGLLETIVARLPPVEVKPPDDPVLAKHIGALGIPDSLQGKLLDANIRTVGDLVGKSSYELRCLRHFGERHQKAVREALARFGLKLADE
jgi:DNA-directed RNA polymerase alpha subunit